ncbi:MAG: DUF1428 domain-containing protein [Rhizobiaceae bacterium]
MSYVDGFVAAVQIENKEKFIEHAQYWAKIFKEYGALKVVENWGIDVPDGELTSFPLAVKKKEDETVVFSWIIWESKEAHEAAWAKLMVDERMNSENMSMPFDGKRIIFGQFETVVEE